MHPMVWIPDYTLVSHWFFWRYSTEKLFFNVLLMKPSMPPAYIYEKYVCFHGTLKIRTIIFWSKFDRMEWLISWIGSLWASNEHPIKKIGKNHSSTSKKMLKFHPNETKDCVDNVWNRFKIATKITKNAEIVFLLFLCSFYQIAWNNLWSK